MTYETILYDLAGAVARIALNRPEKRNSLNSLMRRELRHALERASAEARVAVLTGAGAGFCAGQDLGDAASLADIDLEGVLRDEYEPLLRAIADAPIPVIAAVNGAAAGAGANLALAADVVIAARSAVFVEAFARIGLIPDAGGTWLLPRLVGLPRAMGMCLFAEPIPAGRAAEWGLIWEVVEDDQLDGRATDLAARLARGPAAAYARTKKALRAGLSNDLEAQLALEAHLQGEAGRTRDFLEGVTAFLEKREARFEGR
ncbi:MAG: enoyl-CoA hydratase-related protein [Rubrimonas sp.]|uniref:enoyl-CoA hydratase-related protein n=1 Tax=Rubrimonas sp. TaxID=2036015 RepID=UPI002FDD87D1